PNSPLHLSNRAHALLLLNRPQASLADADHAVRLRPDWGKGHYHRGLALSALMRNEEALLALCTSAVLDKNPHKVRHELTR
ncbi:protein STIP1 homolog, partial [Copidosoma floridanum]|uniref:protein STIP1 homolog n=1 Tax=Copidosoma floridanum TaxID=29053 RepID=UPI0006C9514F